MRYHADPVLVILDTNVLVSAVRSRRGASFQILRRIGGGTFNLVVSVPLVLEYEAALLRHLPETALDEDDALAIIDYVCLVAKRQPIFLLWRPMLRDPKDDMIAEAAIAAGCDAVVTHNVTDFDELAKFGVRVLRPAAFLLEIGGSK
jgi:predicted nucleic acid-binding protein